MEVCSISSNFSNVRLPNTDEDVFRLYVGVNDLALGVEVVKALQDLLHNQFHVVQWDALVVTSNYELEEVVTKNFKDHAHVGSIDTTDLEVIQ